MMMEGGADTHHQTSVVSIGLGASPLDRTLLHVVRAFVSGELISNCFYALLFSPALVSRHGTFHANEQAGAARCRITHERKANSSTKLSYASCLIFTNDNNL